MKLKVFVRFLKKRVKKPSFCLFKSLFLKINLKEGNSYCKLIIRSDSETNAGLPLVPWNQKGGGEREGCHVNPAV